MAYLSKPKSPTVRRAPGAVECTAQDPGGLDIIDRNAGLTLLGRIVDVAIPMTSSPSGGPLWLPEECCFHDKKVPLVAR